eukprot:4938776-Amphidinium_carterae.2
MQRAPDPCFKPLTGSLALYGPFGEVRETNLQAHPPGIVASTLHGCNHRMDTHPRSKKRAQQDHGANTGSISSTNAMLFWKHAGACSKAKHIANDKWHQRAIQQLHQDV